MVSKIFFMFYGEKPPELHDKNLLCENSLKNILLFYIFSMLKDKSTLPYAQKFDELFLNNS